MSTIIVSYDEDSDSIKINGPDSKNKLVNTAQFYTYDFDGKSRDAYKNINSVKFTKNQRIIRILDMIKDGTQSSCGDLTNPDYKLYNPCKVDCKIYRAQIDEEFNTSIPGYKLDNWSQSINNIANDSKMIEKRSWIKVSKGSLVSQPLEYNYVFKETGINPDSIMVDPTTNARVKCVFNLANEVIDPAKRSGFEPGDYRFPSDGTKISFDGSFMKFFGLDECNYLDVEVKKGKYDYKIALDKVELTPKNVNIPVKGPVKVNWFAGNQQKGVLFNTFGEECHEKQDRTIMEQYKFENKEYAVNWMKRAVCICKELGDFMQIAFMFVFANYVVEPDKTYTMVTSDKVVYTMCCILNLNCILFHGYSGCMNDIIGNPDEDPSDEKPHCYNVEIFRPKRHGRLQEWYINNTVSIYQTNLNYINALKEIYSSMMHKHVSTDNSLHYVDVDHKYDHFDTACRFFALGKPEPMDYQSNTFRLYIEDLVAINNKLKIELETHQAIIDRISINTKEGELKYVKTAEAHIKYLTETYLLIVSIVKSPNIRHSQPTDYQIRLNKLYTLKSPPTFESKAFGNKYGTASIYDLFVRDYRENAEDYMSVEEEDQQEEDDIKHDEPSNTLLVKRIRLPSSSPSSISQPPLKKPRISSSDGNTPDSNAQQEEPTALVKRLNSSSPQYPNKKPRISSSEVNSQQGGSAPKPNPNSYLEYLDYDDTPMEFTHADGETVDINAEFLEHLKKCITQELGIEFKIPTDNMLQQQRDSINAETWYILNEYRGYLYLVFHIEGEVFYGDKLKALIRAYHDENIASSAGVVQSHVSRQALRTSPVNTTLKRRRSRQPGTLKKHAPTRADIEKNVIREVKTHLRRLNSTLHKSELEKLLKDARVIAILRKHPDIMVSIKEKMGRTHATMSRKRSIQSTDKPQTRTQKRMYY